MSKVLPRAKLLRNDKFQSPFVGLVIGVVVVVVVVVIVVAVGSSSASADRLPTFVCDLA